MANRYSDSTRNPRPCADNHHEWERVRALAPPFTGDPAEPVRYVDRWRCVHCGWASDQIKTEPRDHG